MRKTLLIIADDHQGHPFALPPGPDGWETADGQYLGNSDWQNVLWEHYVDWWTFAGELRRGGELIVVHAGDAIEGQHHGTVQLVTNRIDEQERMHIAAMRHGLKLARFNPKRDKLLYLAGTETHVGAGNAATERIVRALLAVETLDGQEIRQRLFSRINDVLFDVAHKGFRLGKREWTRTNAMRAYLESAWFRALKTRKPLPRYVIRAHNHTFGHATLEDDAGCTIAEAYLMPAFKLKDEYVSSFEPEAVANIGMLAFTITDKGVSTPHVMTMQCEQDPIEDL